MVKKDLLIQCKGIPVFRNSLLSLLFFFVLSLNGFSQAHIVCNDNVQISLDGNCEAIVTPEAILEGILADYDPPFTIKIGAPGVINNETDHPIITLVGHYVVTVTNSTGNYCWSTITVEDKLGPNVECDCPEGNTDPNCEFTCADEADFFAGLLSYPKPVAVDACTGTNITTSTSDQLIIHGDNGCDGKTLIRTWVFKDAYGNSSTCKTEYRFTPADVNDITLDAPYNSPVLDCGSDASPEGIFEFYNNKLYNEYLASYLTQVPGTYANANLARLAAQADAKEEAYKYAYPIIYGKPIIGQVCKLLSTKSDVVFPVCESTCSNSFKVSRTWTIIDWCTNEEREFKQLIMAVDTEAPVLTVNDLTVSVDPWSCEANFLLPAPTSITDNCDANPTYFVRGSIGVNVRLDIPSGRYLVTQLPKGNHVFKYIAIDCCGNEGITEMTVTVVDKTPPVAIAKEHIVISLTRDGDTGFAKLFATSVDNGSYDSCTPVHLEIRRDRNPDNPNDGCGYSGNFTYNDDGHPNDGSSNPNSPNYDPDGGAYVKFCCDDLTNFDGPYPYGEIMVWLRVWDDGDDDGIYGSAGDNYNETWAIVRVEDKLPPTITCPPTVTISCNDDIDNLELTGSATAKATCNNLEVTYTDREFLGTCNVGYVDRTWRVKGRSDVNCTQRIYIQNPGNPFSSENITWPIDVETDCTDNAIDSKPTWVAGPCDMIGYSLKADTFYFEGNACMKILRHWTVMNWCVYNPNEPNTGGIYYHTQVVKIIDNEKPVLGSCEPLSFEIDDHLDADGDGNICEKRNLKLTQTATDQGQCASDWLKWVVLVDLYGDGTYDYEFSSFLPVTDGTFNDTNNNGIPDIYVAPTGQGGTVSITIPEDIVGSFSTHKVSWKVYDGCGNFTECIQNFTVEDKKKPTPYCLHISSALMLNGQVELWANDFNLGSYDNCTSSENLLYTFENAFPIQSKLNETHYFKGNGQPATEAEYYAGIAQKWMPSMNSSGRVFTCDDLPFVIVKMTVWDERGNFEYCEVRLDLLDNQNACGDDITTTVSGRVVTPGGVAVADAEITMDNGVWEMQNSVFSTTSGYTFPAARMNYDYTLTGTRNDAYYNGVNTLDLVHIQRHVLGLQKFTDAFQIIAADANNDQRVTVADISDLRKLILGIYTELPHNQSWRLVNNQNPFAEATNPFPFNETINITNLSQPMSNQSFIAVKIGDVDGTAESFLAGGTTETRSSQALTTENQVMRAGEVTEVVLDAEVSDIYGLQFTMNLKDADLVDAYIGNEKLSQNNIAKISDNTYTVSWNEINGVKGNELITLYIASKTDSKVSDILSINSKFTSAEIYSGEDLSTSKLSLRFVDNNVESFELFQNEPNPFNDKTQISFNLPEAGVTTLKIYDVNGKMVYTKSDNFTRGLHSFTISKKDLPSTGVMIYQIESGNNIATKKMIGLE